MECVSAEVSCEGRTIHVLDTPGLSDPEATEAEIHAKIIASVEAMAEAHPDAQFAVALVASLAGRLDETVLSTFSNLGLVFGRSLFDHATLVWTHGDLLLEEATALAALEPGAPTAGALVEEEAMDTAYAAYLASAGETLTTWLANVKGGSLVFCNRGEKAAGVELRRLVDRAWEVSGRASQLAPPKPHRKTARRQRQQEMLQNRHQRGGTRAENDGPAAPAARGGSALGWLASWFYAPAAVKEPQVLQDELL